MRIRNYSVVLTLIGLLCLGSLVVSSAQQCGIRDGASARTSLFPQIDETGEVPLDTFFYGQNLKFSLQLDAPKYDQIFSVVNQVQLKDTKPIGKKISQFIHVDNFQRTDGSLSIAALYVDRIGGKRLYSVAFQKNFKGNSAPQFVNFFSIPVGESQTQSCFDVNFLNETTLVVECMEKMVDQKDELLGQQSFYLIDTANVHIYTNKGLKFSLTSAFVDRKSMTYRLGNLTFFLTGLIYDELLDQAESQESYVQVYIWNQDSADEQNPLGKLSAHSLITGDDIGLNSSLQLMDFDVQDDWITILDYSRGLYVFRHSGAKQKFVKNLTIYSLESLGLQKAFGLNVQLDGGFTLLQIAGESRINSFHVQSLSENKTLTMLTAHEVPFLLISRVAIASTANVITVQIGDLLLIFDRYDPDYLHIKQVLLGVEYHSLLYKNALLVYQGSETRYYNLNRPWLVVRGAGNSSLVGLTTEVRVTATSVSDLKSVECSLSFKVEFFADTSNVTKFTHVADQLHYIFDEKTEELIKLDTQYVGPDLHYIAISPNEEEDFEDISIEFDLPQDIQTSYQNIKLNASALIFERQILLDDDVFVQIHQYDQQNQDGTYNLLSFTCFQLPKEVEELSCYLGTEKKVAGKIRDFSVGEWDDYYYYAIVLDDNKTIHIYDIASSEVYNLTLVISDPGVTILDLEILQNQLFLILSNATVSVYRNYGQKDLRWSFQIDAAYVQSWGLAEPWVPEKLVVHQFQPNVLLVQLRQSVVLISILGKPLLLETITVSQDAGDKWSATVTRNGLTVFLEDKNAKQEIREYSLIDLKDLDQKSVFLRYGYRYYSQAEGIVSTSSNNTGLLYVLAVNATNNEDLSLLVLRTGQFQISQFYSSIPVEGVRLSDLGQGRIQLHADGNEVADYVFLNLAGKNLNFRIPIEPALILSPGDEFPITSYTHTYLFRYQVIGLDLTPRPVEETIIFVNPQEKVYVQDSAIEFSGVGSLNCKTGEDEIKWQFNSNKWASGPVLGYEMSCADCPSSFKLINKVQAIQNVSGIPAFELMQGSFFDESSNMIVILDSETVYFFDERLQEKFPPIDLAVEQIGFGRCADVIPAESNEEYQLLYVLAICKIGGRTYVSAIDTNTDDGDLVAKEPILLREIKNVGKAKWLRGKLYIVNEDPQESILYVYNLAEAIQKEFTYAETIYSFSKKSLGLELRVNFTTFEIAPTETDDLKIIYLMNGTNLGYHFLINSTSLEIIDEGNLDYDNNAIFFIEEIQKDHLYLEPDSQFLNVQLVDSEVMGSLQTERKLVHRILLLTSNSATYELIIVFGYGANNTHNLQNFYTMNVFGNVGGENYRNLEWIEYFEGYFTTQYFNVETNSVVLAVYYTQPFDLLSSQTNGFKDDIGIEFFNMIGGVSLKLVTSVGIDVQIQNMVLPGPQKTRVLVFDPSNNNQAVFYELDHQYLTIKVLDRDYEPQSFQLSFVTDNKQKLPKIQGQINRCKLANFDPICIESEETVDQMFLYPEVSESLEVELRQYIQGHNLTYTVETDADSQLEQEIENALNPQGVPHEFPNSGVTIAVAQRQRSNGDMSIFRLSEKVSAGKKHYYLAHLVSDGRSNPALDFDRELTDANPSNTACLDLAALSDNLVLIDCVQKVVVFDSSDQDFYIIYNITSGTSQTQKFKTEYKQNERGKYNKKSLAYGMEGDGIARYLISSPRYKSGSAEQIGFLNIYYFDRANTDVQHPEGKLMELKFLDEEDLGLEQLNVVDFEVLDELVLVMDFEAGIVSFQFQYDPQSKTGQGTVSGRVSLPFQLFGLVGASDFWVGKDGGFQIFGFTDDKQIQLFRLDNLRSQAPEPAPINTFLVPFEPLVQAELQFNAEYVVYRTVETLYVFRRSVVFGYQAEAVLEDVSEFELVFNNYLFVYAQTSVQAYLLQRPVYFVNPQKLYGPFTVLLKATSVSGDAEPQVCQAFIVVQVVPRESKKSYPTQRIETGDLLYHYEFAEGPALDVYLDEYEIGADLRYQLNKPNRLDEPLFNCELSVPEQIAFEVQGGDPNRTYSFTATANVFSEFQVIFRQEQTTNSVYIFYCYPSWSEIVDLQCDEQRKRIDLGAPILHYSYGVWKNEYVFGFVLAGQESKVYTYRLTGERQDLMQIGSAKFTDLEILNNQMHLVDDEALILGLESFRDRDEEFEYVIDRDYVSGWELLDWSVKRVLSNKDYPDLLVVRTPTEFLLVNTQGRPVFQQRYSQQTTSFDLAFSSQSLFVFNWDDPKAHRIEEYSLTNLNNLIERKELEMYDFSLLLDPAGKRAFFAVANTTGQLFVLAKRSSDSDSLYVLVYNADVPNVRALHKAIRLERVTLSKLDFQKPLDITVSGDDEVDYCIITIDKETKMIRAPVRSSIVVTPGNLFPYDRYTSESDFQFYVVSLDGNYVHHQEKLVFVNQQTQVFQNQFEIDASGISELSADNADADAPTQWTFDVSEWFSGPVLGFALECMDCRYGSSGREVIQLINKVGLVEQSDSQYKQISKNKNVGGTYFDATSGKLVQINKNIAYIYNRNLSLGTPVTLDADTKLTCLGVKPLYDDTGKLTHFVALCKQSSQYYAYPIEITDTLPKSLARVQINGLVVPGKFKLMDGKLLIVSESGNSEVIVFDFLKAVANNLTEAPEVIRFGNKHFNFTTLDLINFDLSENLQSEYRSLFLVNGTEHICHVQLNRTTYQPVTLEGEPGTVWIQLVRYLQNSSLYFTPRTDLLNFEITNVSKKGSGSSEETIFEGLLFTEDTAIYQVQLYFLSKDLHGLLRFITLTPIRTHGNYGKGLVSAHANVFKRFFVVGYRVEDIGEYVAVVYSLDNLDTSNSAGENKADIPFQNMLGGHTFKSAPGTARWHFALYEDGKNNIRVLVPSPFQDASQVILQVNDLQKIRIRRLSDNIYKQSFQLRVLSAYYSPWNKAIRGRIQPLEQKFPSAFCNVLDQTVSDLNLYVETKERAYFDLATYFSGYNLTFEVELDSTDLAFIEQVGPLQNRAISDLAPRTEFVALSSYLASNNKQYVAKLLETPDSEIEDTYTYSLQIGIGEGRDELESSTLELKLTGNVRCYSLVQMDEKHTVIDCIQFREPENFSTAQSLYALVRQEGTELKVYEQVLGTVLVTPGYKIYRKKSVGFQYREKNEGFVYLISTPVWENLERQDAIGYLVILQLDRDFTGENFLTSSGIIAVSDFPSLQGKKFNVLDFAVLGDLVYLVDNEIDDLVCFRYQNGSVVSGSDYLLPESALGLKNVQGIELNYDGNLIQLVLAAGDAIYSFHQDGYRQIPRLIATYEVYDEFFEQPDIEVNSRFVTCLQGANLFIFSRRDKDALLIVLEDVEGQVLLQDNYLFYVSDMRLYSSLIIEPYFVINPVRASEGERFLEVTAISTSYGVTERCEQVLFVNFLDQGRRAAAPTPRETPLQTILENEPTEDVFLDLKFVGPDLRYEVDAADGRTIQPDVPQLVELSYPGAQQRKSEDWNFSAVIYLSESRQYHIHQNKTDLTLQIFECLDNLINISLTTCSPRPPVPMAGAISSMSYGQWNNSFLIGFVDGSDGYQRIRMFNESGLPAPDQDILVPSAFIKDFEFDQNELYLINAKTVEVWGLIEGRLTNLENISAETVKTWELQGSDKWEPERLETRAQIPGVLFVQSGDALVLLSVQQRATLIGSFLVKAKKDYWELTRNSLLIFEGYTTSTPVLTERSLRDLTTIREIDKYFFLYDYAYLTPLVFDVSNATDLLAVLVTDSAKTKLFIAFIKTNTPAISTFYRVVPVPVPSLAALDGQPLTLSIDGLNGCDYAYLNAAGESYLFRVPHYPRAIIYLGAEFPLYEYTKPLNLAWKVTDLTNTSYSVNSRLLFVNRETRVRLNSAQIESSKFKNLDQSNFDGDYYWKFLASDWSSGPILRYELSCPVCANATSAGSLTLENRVQKFSASELDSSAIQNLTDIVGQYYDQSRDEIVLLNKTSVYYYETSLKLKYSLALNFGAVPVKACEQILPGFNSLQNSLNYTIVICKTDSYEESKWVLVAINLTSTGQGKPVQSAVILLDDIQIAGKAEMKDGKLVLVNLDEQDSTIYVYSIESDIAQQNSQGTVIRMYNERTLRERDLEITSFEIANTQLDDVRILFLTNTTKQFSVYLVNRSSYAILTDNIHRIDLAQILNKYNLYFTSKTVILNTKLLETRTLQDKQIKYDLYRMLIVTADTYVYDLEITCTQYQNGTYKFYNVTPGYAYQTYGKGVPRPHISTYGRLFGLSYWNKDLDYELAVVFYSAPELPDNLATLGDPSILSTIGGYQFNYITDSELYPHSYFQIFPINSQSTVGVLTPNPQLRESPIVLQITDDKYFRIILNEPEINPQNLTLRVISDFAEGVQDIQGKLNIKIEPVDPVPIDPSVYPEPYCKQIKGGFKKIFTSIGETVQYRVSDYFEGYNLEVRGNYSDKPELEVAKIINPVVERIQTPLTPIYTVKRQSAFHSVSGEDYIGRLFEQKYSIGYSKYFVNFQHQDETYEKSSTTEIPGSLDLSIKCYGITMMERYSAIVSCMQRDKDSSKISDLFIIVNSTDKSKPTFTQVSFPTNFKDFVPRKSESLKQSSPDKKFDYLIVAPIYDSQSTTPRDQIYIYTYQNQNLTSQFSSNKSDPLKKLDIYDFATLDEYIFLLNENKTLEQYFFSGTELTQTKSTNYSKLGVTDARGIEVNYDGGYIHLCISFGSTLQSYRMTSFNSDPTKLLAYTLQESIKGQSEINVNSQFIAVLNQQTLTIFDRRWSDPRRTVRVFTRVQQFYLDYKNTLEVITIDSYYLYALQVPRLELHQNTNMGVRNFSLEVWSNSGNKTVNCIVQFSEETVEKNSTQIRNRGGEPPQFDLSTSTVKKFPLDNIYVGPNLQFSPQTSNGQPELIFDIPQPISIKYPDKFVETPGDWIFNRIIQSDSDPQFHYHQSGKDFFITILECFPKLMGRVDEIECYNIHTIKTLKGPVAHFSEGVWHNEALLGIVDSSANKTVRFFTLNGVVTPQYDIDVPDAIVGLEILQNQVFVLTDKGEILVYEIYTLAPFKIDSLYVLSWQLSSSWAPSRIETHQNYPNTLFVANGEEIVLISTERNPTILSKIPNVLAGKSTSFEMVLNAQSLLVIRWDSAFKTEIIELSLWDLNAPVQLNSYELYNYSIYFRSSTKRPVFAVSNTTGILTILGTKTGETDNVYVLVYKNNYPNIQALDRAIPITVGARDTLEQFPLEITVSGEDTFDIAYMTIKNQSVALSLPKDPTLIIKTSQLKPANGYSEPVVVSIKAQDMSGQSMVLQQKVVLVNSQPEITKDQSEELKSNFRSLTEYNFNNFYLNEWSVDVSTVFKGPVLYYKISCANCNQRNMTSNADVQAAISILNKVDRSNSEKIDQAMEKIKNLTGIKSSFYEPETKVLVLLSGLRVYILNDLLSIKSETYIPLASSCDDIAPGYMSLNSEFYKIVVLCKLNSQYYAYYIDPQNPATDLKTGQVLQNLLRPKKIKFVDQKLLISTDAFDSVGQATTSGEVYIYEVTSSNTNLIEAIGNGKFISKEHEGKFSFSTFDVIPGFDQNYRVIVLGNEVRWLVLYSVNQASYQAVKEGEFQQFNFQDLIYSKDLYFSKTSQLINIESLGYTGGKLDLLVVGQDTAIYRLSLDVKLVNNSVIQMQGSHEIKQFFSNYGSYLPLYTVSRLDDYFVQGYWSEGSEKLVFVLHYLTQDQASNTSIQIQPFIGGDELSRKVQDVPPSPFCLFKSIYLPTKPAVFFPNYVTGGKPAAYVEYDRKSVTLVTNSAGQSINNQTIKLQPYNDIQTSLPESMNGRVQFSVLPTTPKLSRLLNFTVPAQVPATQDKPDPAQVQTSIHPGPQSGSSGPSSQGSSSNDGWAIALIVISCLFFAAVIGLFAYKKFRTSNISEENPNISDPLHD